MVGRGSRIVNRKMDCYRVSRSEIVERSPFPVTVVRDRAALDREVARRIVDRIAFDAAASRETALVLPVGPVEYEPLAELCNRRRAPLGGVTIFMMDEYLDGDSGAPVPAAHPLSFRGFMERSLLRRLDPSLGFARDRLVFPLPEVLEEVSRRILERGGADLCVAAVGITGHLAFNDPPEAHETDKDLDWVRKSTARIVTVNRESTAQMALGWTHGDWSIVPRRAVTLGMKEILASRKIVVCGMRTWHAGTVRRALFGPVSRDCPASLVQEHPDVEVVLTELAAAPPAVHVTLDTGEEA
jgi:glucosamine-6-phosphate deaminase